MGCAARAPPEEGRAERREATPIQFQEHDDEVVEITFHCQQARLLMRPGTEFSRRGFAFGDPALRGRVHRSKAAISSWEVFSMAFYRAPPRPRQPSVSAVGCPRSASEPLRRGLGKGNERSEPLGRSIVGGGGGFRAARKGSLQGR